MRYWFGFTENKTGKEGLLPVFTLFKKEEDLSDAAAPEILEAAGGLYYFDYEPAENMIFVVDAGSADLDIRTIFGRCGPDDENMNLIKQIFWTLCNRLVIRNATGAYTIYKDDGVTPGLSGTLVDNGETTVRTPA